MDENNIKKLDNVSGEYASKMMNYIKEILDWIYDQGKEITREVLECKLQEAYKTREMRWLSRNSPKYA